MVMPMSNFWVKLYESMRKGAHACLSIATYGVFCNLLSAVGPSQGVYELIPGLDLADAVIHVLNPAPGKNRAKDEQAIREAVPELFGTQPNGDEPIFQEVVADGKRLLVVTSWEKFNGSARSSTHRVSTGSSTAAERSRAYRERKKAERDAAASPNTHAHVTEPNASHRTSRTVTPSRDANVTSRDEHTERDARDGTSKTPVILTFAKRDETSPNAPPPSRPASRAVTHETPENADQNSTVTANVTARHAPSRDVTPRYRKEIEIEEEQAAVRVPVQAPAPARTHESSAVPAGLAGAFFASLSSASLGLTEAKTRKLAAKLAEQVPEGSEKQAHQALAESLKAFAGRTDLRSPMGTLPLIFGDHLTGKVASPKKTDEQIFLEHEEAERKRLAAQRRAEPQTTPTRISPNEIKAFLGTLGATPTGIRKTPPSALSVSDHTSAQAAPADAPESQQIVYAKVGT